MADYDDTVEACKPFTVMTVCTGNICRSPMGEIILRQYIEERGLAGRVVVDSTGVSSEEYGNPIDWRAQKVLRARGYEVPAHSARKITVAEARDTDLLLPMTAAHMRSLMRIVPSNHQGVIRMYRSFDPDLNVAPESIDDSIDLVDPWYGGMHDFEIAINQIESVAPYIVDYIEEQLANQ